MRLKMTQKTKQTGKKEAEVQKPVKNENCEESSETEGCGRK